MRVGAAQANLLLLSSRRGRGPLAARLNYSSGPKTLLNHALARLGVEERPSVMAL